MSIPFDSELSRSFRILATRLLDNDALFSEDLNH